MSVLLKIDVKVEIPKCRRQLGPRHRWYCNIKMDLTEVKCGKITGLVIENKEKYKDKMGTLGTRFLILDGRKKIIDALRQEHCFSK
jgi:hypothetical protein